MLKSSGSRYCLRYFTRIRRASRRKFWASGVCCHWKNSTYTDVRAGKYFDETHIHLLYFFFSHGLWPCRCIIHTAGAVLSIRFWRNASSSISPEFFFAGIKHSDGQIFAYTVKCVCVFAWIKYGSRKVFFFFLCEHDYLNIITCCR